MDSKTLLTFLLLLVAAGAVSSHGHSDFSEAKELIENKVSCDKLSDEQLELIGDYFMEQMHPSEEHELMDDMMGGEGSESLRLMHIRMARRMYCGEGGMMGAGMMGSGMMGAGMMDSQGIMGSDMMSGYSFWSPWNLIWLAFWLLILIGLVLLVVWLSKKVFEKKEKSVIEILKKRYAKGEITKKQFEEMKKDLRG